MQCEIHLFEALAVTFEWDTLVFGIKEDNISGHDFTRPYLLSVDLG